MNNAIVICMTIISSILFLFLGILLVYVITKWIAKRINLENYLLAVFLLQCIPGMTIILLILAALRIDVGSYVNKAPRTKTV